MSDHQSANRLMVAANKLSINAVESDMTILVKRYRVKPGTAIAAMRRINQMIDMWPSDPTYYMKLGIGPAYCCKMMILNDVLRRAVR